MNRLFQRLDELYGIGGGPGANRIGYSAEEDEAHRLVSGWMGEAGLEVSVDEAGNLFGRVRGSGPGTGEVWTGSHLDTVPRGGKFDGALGVVAGLEAVARVGQAARTLGVVAFRDEERGCAGSRALVARGELPARFVELHVEQGPRLAAGGAPLGVVTGVAGIVRATRTFEGRAGHAGTVPMEGREDALCAAAEYVLRVRDLASAIEGAVATVGRLEVEPCAANIVPGRVTLSVDARAPDRARLEALVEALAVEPAYRSEPTPMSPELIALIGEEIAGRGLEVVELASGAGHDAGVLAAAGAAAGMLFVRSLNGGASHSPGELSSGEDVALGLDVLAGVLRRLASE